MSLSRVDGSDLKEAKLLLRESLFVVAFACNRLNNKHQYTQNWHKDAPQDDHDFGDSPAAFALHVRVIALEDDRAPPIHTIATSFVRLFPRRHLRDADARRPRARRVVAPPRSVADRADGAAFARCRR